MARRPVPLPREATPEMLDGIEALPADDNGWLDEPVEARVAALNVRLRDPSKRMPVVAMRGAPVTVRHKVDLRRLVEGRALVAPGEQVPGEFVEDGKPITSDDTGAAEAFATEDTDVSGRAPAESQGGGTPSQEPGVPTSTDGMDAELVAKVRDSSGNDIVAHAGDDPDLAAALILVEQAVASESKRDPRKNVVEPLQRLVDEATPDGDDDLVDD